MIFEVYYNDTIIKSVEAFYLKDPSHSLADKIYQMIFAKKIGCKEIEEDSLHWINLQTMQTLENVENSDNEVLSVVFEDNKVLTNPGYKILIKVEDYTGQVEFMLVTPNIISTRNDITVDYYDNVFEIELANYHKNHGGCEYILQSILPSVVTQQIVLAESNVIEVPQDIKPTEATEI